MTASVEIAEMDPSTEYFVGTCSHVDESAEADECGRHRLTWLREMRGGGLRVKVALLDEKPVGFIYFMPIEVCPWGPAGRELMVIPCLWVIKEGNGVGASGALIEAAEMDARDRGAKGIVTEAYYWDFWFMPAGFFEKMGYAVAVRRGDRALLWKAFDPSAEAPRFLEPAYSFEPVPGKVVVDLFWNRFCQTSEIEAQRVREVVAEFGGKVQLNEYPAHEVDVRDRYQIPRGIYVNGREIFWGHEAPREGIREAVLKALDEE